MLQDLIYDVLGTIAVFGGAIIFATILEVLEHE